MSVIGIGFSSMVGMYYHLQSEINEAKELPEPTITRIEYEIKDEMIRNSILNANSNISEIKEDVKMIKAKLYE